MRTAITTSPPAALLAVGGAAGAALAGRRRQRPRPPRPRRRPSRSARRSSTGRCTSCATSAQARQAPRRAPRAPAPAPAAAPAPAPGRRRSPRRHGRARRAAAHPLERRPAPRRRRATSTSTRAAAMTEPRLAPPRRPGLLTVATLVAGRLRRRRSLLLVVQLRVGPRPGARRAAGGRGGPRAAPRPRPPRDRRASSSTQVPRRGRRRARARRTVVVGAAAAPRPRRRPAARARGSARPRPRPAGDQDRRDRADSPSTAWAPTCAWLRWPARRARGLGRARMAARRRRPPVALPRATASCARSTPIRATSCPASRAPARGGRRRPLGGRADRRPRRPDAARRALPRRLRALAGRASRRPPLAAALAAAPPRRAGAPAPGARAGARARRRSRGRHDPPAARRRLDTGGTGKGLAADAVAHRLGAACARFAVDCGGDVRVGGDGARARGRSRSRSSTRSPASSPTCCGSAPAAIATSGIDVAPLARPGRRLRPPSPRPGDRRAGVDRARVARPRSRRPRSRPRRWRRPRCSPAPAAAPRVLAEHGGVLVHDDGDVELVGRCAPPRAPAVLRCEARRHDRARPRSSYGWWLASRASGVVALALVTLSVGVGLAMAGRVARRPGLSRVAAWRCTSTRRWSASWRSRVHGVTLLGDPWLHPGRRGDRGPVHHGLPPGLHRLGHRRRLPRRRSSACRSTRAGASGPRLWRRAHRATVARLRSGRRPRARRRHGRVDAVAARARCSSPASPIGLLFARRVRRPSPAPAAGGPAHGRRGGRDERRRRDRGRRPGRPALLRDPPRARLGRADPDGRARSTRPTTGRRCPRGCSRNDTAPPSSRCGRRRLARRARRRPACSGRRAVGLDPAAARVLARRRARALRYDALVVATGGAPRTLARPARPRQRPHAAHARRRPRAARRC